MRIMLVTFRFGKDIPGGAERYLWELVTRLAARGHRVEVFTTCSLQMLMSPFGYMLWDNSLPAGRVENDGVVVHRFPVHNPRPWRAHRLWERLISLHERERQKPEFGSYLAEVLEGINEHCLLSGWYACEQWDGGQARWSKKRARFLVGGRGITDIWLEVSSPLDERLILDIAGVRPLRFDLEKGRQPPIHVTLPARDSVSVGLRVSRTLRPPEDRRDLGLLVRRISVGDENGIRELDLSRGWAEFVESGPEEPLGKALWWLTRRMPRRASGFHRYVMGPISHGMERGVMRAARDFDVVIGSMAPMSTLSLAAGAAGRCGKPFIAFPLFHTRDPNHYFAHLYQAMKGAWGVEANLPGIAGLMAAWGFSAFAVGPGFDLEEVLSERVDGGRFRREFGFDDSPMLLWVARKNTGKGYEEAIAALEYVRSQGCPAILVMIGPDEDYLPVSGEGVHYLGSLPREKVLDAYDACDVFIFPSLHESFCLVFCEAWLRGKPVLGNAYCAAARYQIAHGEDGYLCRDRLEYGRRALQLLQDPGLARGMGQRGKEKVMASRGWDGILQELEGKLREAARPPAGGTGRD